MKNINFPMLLLAMLVIFLFAVSGVAIAYGNLWFVLLFILLGTATMGYGISLKTKSDS
ncbi:MAG TPA: DUF5325 family protein [Virgibacillus sp.]|nr:DUF5325 family protein [Virgibacillus sp.]